MPWSFFSVVGQERLACIQSMLRFVNWAVGLLLLTPHDLAQIWHKFLFEEPVETDKTPTLNVSEVQTYVKHKTLLKYFE